MTDITADITADTTARTTGSVAGTMTAPTTPSRRRLLTALCWFMAAEFVVGGIAKFLPGETWFGPAAADRFVDWGYPAWFRFVVGAGEIVAGVLLVTRRRVLGAALLVVILTGATLTVFLNHDPLRDSTMAPLHLALALLVVWATRDTARSALARRRTSTPTGDR